MTISALGFGETWGFHDTRLETGPTPVATFDEVSGIPAEPGDLLLCLVTYKVSTLNTATCSVNISAGWDLVQVCGSSGGGSFGTTRRRSALYWRRADGTAADTPTITAVHSLTGGSGTGPTINSGVMSDVTVFGYHNSVPGATWNLGPHGTLGGVPSGTLTPPTTSPAIDAGTLMISWAANRVSGTSPIMLAAHGFTLAYMFNTQTGPVPGVPLFEDALVRAPGNVNINAAPATIDGLPMSNGERVLLPFQSSPLQSGLYVWPGLGAPFIRADDGDTPEKLQRCVIHVTSGATGTNTRYYQSEPLYGAFGAAGGAPVFAPATSAFIPSVTIADKVAAATGSQPLPEWLVTQGPGAGEHHAAWAMFTTQVPRGGWNIRKIGYGGF